MPDSRAASRPWIEPVWQNRRRRCVPQAMSWLLRGCARAWPRAAALPARLLLVLASLAGGHAQAAPAAPDLELLEYLGRLEQQEGRWVGPDDMASATPEEAEAARRQARVERQPAADKRAGVPASTATPSEDRQHVD